MHTANMSKAAAATAVALVSIMVPGDGDLVANDDEGMLPQFGTEQGDPIVHGHLLVDGPEVVPDQVTNGQGIVHYQNNARCL